MSKFADHYSNLGVNENATVSEILAAYKKQCLKWHPDRNPEFEATNKMQEINEAKRLLSDSKLRETYNKEYQAYKVKSARQSKGSAKNEESKQPTPATNYTFILKTDSELINICSKAAKYNLEYIYAVLQELKKRNYSFDTIKEIVKQRHNPPA